ncbi:CGNR zinc finger domain-containing protein [Nonomuraea angiospora]|uniref:CGNR zinc finger domain-containing protein n=1 Tax=Nonomuraea angiospora TaxID=46172 RepID=UPI0029A23FB2|nr:CGNR zinc finger domain-containing protein [Nonomuraea angiospora]MDX3111772.1 CGNR zinc finger domain-containing protein [Nonomuraea angiospora]
MRQFAETGLVALDLANTWDEYLDDPERLPDPAALHRFCHELGEHGELGEGGEMGECGELAGGGQLSVDDLRAVRAVRERLRAVLSCDPPARTRALAQWAHELPIGVMVEDSGGAPRQRLTAPQGADLAERLAVRSVAELLDLAASGDWDRLRLCAADPCKDAFVDHSRPGKRQFCSTRCANRAHAAASRARRR